MSQPIRITIVYDTQGRAVLRQVEQDLNRIAAQAARLNIINPQNGRAFRQVQQDAERLANTMRGNLASAARFVEHSLNRVFDIVTRLGRFGFYTMLGGIAVTTVALNKLGREFLKINEQFRGLEITLKSAFRSAQIARDLRQELVKITATSPIPFEGLAEFVRSSSVTPFSRGKIANQAADGTLSQANGFLKSSIRLAEQLLAFRPDKTIEDVIFSLREALSGQFRSIVRRFDVSMSTISAVSGVSTRDLTADPEKADKALKEFFGKIITPSSIQEYLRQPSVMIKNLFEQLVKVPLLKVGDAGLFDVVIDGLQDIFEQAQEFVTNDIEPIAKSLSEKLGSLLKAVTQSGTNLFESLLSRAGFGSEDMPGGTIERSAMLVSETIGKIAEKLPVFLDKSKEFFNSLLPALKAIADVLLKFGELVVRGINFSPVLTALTLFFASQLPRLVGFAAEKIGASFAGSFSAGYASRSSAALTPTGIPAGAMIRRYTPATLLTPTTVRHQSRDPATGRFLPVQTATGSTGLGAAAAGVVGGIGGLAGSAVRGLAGGVVGVAASVAAYFIFEKSVNAFAKAVGIDSASRERAAQLAEKQREAELASVLSQRSSSEQPIIRILEELKVAKTTVSGRKSFNSLEDVLASEESLVNFSQAEQKILALRKSLGETGSAAQAAQIAEKLAEVIAITRGFIDNAGVAFKSKKLTPENLNAFNDLKEDLLSALSPGDLQEQIEPLAKAKALISQFIQRPGGEIIQILQQFEDSLDEIIDPFKESATQLNSIAERSKALEDTLFKIEEIFADIGGGLAGSAKARIPDIEAIIKRVGKFPDQAYGELTSLQVLDKLEQLKADLASGDFNSKSYDEFLRILSAQQVDLMEVFVETFILDLTKLESRIPSLISGVNDQKILTGMSEALGKLPGSIIVKETILSAYNDLIQASSKIGDDAIVATLEAQQRIIEGLSGLDAGSKNPYRDNLIENYRATRAKTLQGHRIDPKASALNSVGGIGDFVNSTGGAGSQVALERLNQSLRNQLGIDTDTSFLGKNSVGSENLDNLIEKYEKLDPLLHKINDSLSDQADMYRALGLEDVAEKYDQLAESALKSAEANAQALKELTGGGEFRSFKDGFVGAMREIQIEARNFRNVGEQVARGFKEGFGTAFAEFVTGAKSAGEAFRDFGISVVKTLADIASQKLAAQLFSAIAGYAGSFFGPTANTGASSSQNIPGVNTGYSGYVAGGYVAGGRGGIDDIPARLTAGEYVLNRNATRAIGRSNLDMMNSRYGKGYATGGMVERTGGVMRGHLVSSNVNVVVNVDNSGGSADSGAKKNNMNEVGRDIETAVVSIMQKHMRPGGALYNTKRSR